MKGPRGRPEFVNPRRRSRQEFPTLAPINRPVRAAHILHLITREEKERERERGGGREGGREGTTGLGCAGIIIFISSAEPARYCPVEKWRTFESSRAARAISTRFRSTELGSGAVWLARPSLKNDRIVKNTVRPVLSPASHALVFPMLLLFFLINYSERENGKRARARAGDSELLMSPSSSSPLPLPRAARQECLMRRDR